MNNDSWVPSVAPAALVVLLAVFAGSCGDDGGSGDTSTTEQTRSTDTTQTSTGTDGTSGTDSVVDRVVYGVDLSSLDLPGADPYVEYQLLEDDTGRVEVEVPTAWDDVDTSIARREGREVPGIWASTDLEELTSDYATSGLQLDLRTLTSTEAALQMLNSDNATDEVCGEAERFDYDDGRYEGIAELWTDCTDSGAALLQLVVLRDGNQYLTAEFQMLTDADLDATVRALESFTAVDVESGEQWQPGDESTTQSVGSQFVLVVPTNYTVGDLWRVAGTHDEAIVKFLSKDYQPDNPGQIEAGGGGTDFFTFEGVAPGTTTITLENCFRCDTDGDGEVEPGAGEVNEFTEVEVTIE